MLLSDKELIELNQANRGEFISPFKDYKVSRDENDNPIPSYGLSHYGYDVTLGRDLVLMGYSGMSDFFIYDPLANYGDENGEPVTKLQVLVDGKDREYVIIPSKGYVLGHTVETFNIPNDILATCVGKSTYARSGVMVNVTPIEPGFQGQVVLELFNGADYDVKLYIGAGIAQFLFHRGTEVGSSYAGGKYQNQTGITFAR